MKFLKYIFAILLQLGAFSISAFAKEKPSRADSKVIRFNFNNYAVDLEFSIEWNRYYFAGVTSDQSNTQFLKISTPQFRKDSVSKIPVILISDFKELKTINEDIKSLGFESLKVKVEELASGRLFQWQTPTKGSSTYFYYQNSKAKNFAIKIGPFADIIRVDFDIEWDRVRWVPTANSK